MLCPQSTSNTDSNWFVAGIKSCHALQALASMVNVMVISVIFIRNRNFNVLLFLFLGTRVPDRYGNRVPGSKSTRERTALLSSHDHSIAAAVVTATSLLSQ